MYLELSTLTVDREHVQAAWALTEKTIYLHWFIWTLQLYTRWDSGINGKKCITVNFINQSLARSVDCAVFRMQNTHNCVVCTYMYNVNTTSKSIINVQMYILYVLFHICY